MASESSAIRKADKIIREPGLPKFGISGSKYRVCLKHYIRWTRGPKTYDGLGVMLEDEV